MEDRRSTTYLLYLREKERGDSNNSSGRDLEALLVNYFLKSKIKFIKIDSKDQINQYQGSVNLILDLDSYTNPEEMLIAPQAIRTNFPQINYCFAITKLYARHLSALLESGVDDVFYKPLDIDTFNSKIVNYFEEMDSLTIKELPFKDTPTAYREINVDMDLELLEIFEEGCTLISKHYLSPKTYLKLSGELFESIDPELSKQRFEVVRSTYSNKEKAFLTYISFRNLERSNIENISKWISLTL